MLVRLTRFRPTLWRCTFCGAESIYKASICYPQEVRS